MENKSCCQEERLYLLVDIKEETMQIQEFSIIFAVYLAMWILIFLLLARLMPISALSSSVQAQIKFRAIKAVHGILCFILCSLGKTTQFFTGDSVIGTYELKLIILFSSSFFVFDIILAVVMKKAYMNLVVHHIATVIVLTLWIYDPTVMQFEEKYYFTAMIITEVTSGPMHLKDILRILHMRFTRLFATVEMAFLCTFVIARGIFSHSLFFYPLSSDPDLNVVVRVAMGVIWMLSIYFCCLIWGKFKERLRQNKEMSSKDIELEWLTQDHEKLKNLSFYIEQEQRVF